MVNNKTLEAKLVELKEQLVETLQHAKNLASQHEQTMANANAISGAVQALEKLLADNPDKKGK